MCKSSLPDHYLDVFKDCVSKNYDDEQIEKALQTYRARRLNQLSEIQIPDVPEDVFKSFVLFAVTRGYDIDDFMDLIDAKLTLRFEILYKKLHPKSQLLQCPA